MPCQAREPNINASYQETVELRMSDGVVILGTVAIVGLVAVATVALVYDRTLGITGSRGKIHIETGETRTLIEERETQPDESRKELRVD